MRFLELAVFVIGFALVLRAVREQSRRMDSHLLALETLIMAQKDEITSALNAATAELDRLTTASQDQATALQNISVDVDALLAIAQGGGGGEPVDLTELVAKASELRDKVTVVADAAQANADAAKAVADKYNP